MNRVAGGAHVAALTCLFVSCWSPGNQRQSGGDEVGTRARERNSPAPFVGKDSAPFVGNFLAVERERAANTHIPSSNRTSQKDLKDYRLEDIQAHIRPSEALLSIALGSGFSSLWGIAGNSFEFHRLPPADQLLDLVHRFRRSVESSSPDRDVIGLAIYQLLFGGLSAKLRDKPEWLISAEDAWFDAPFASLVVGNSKGTPVYFVEQHSTTRISSALLIRTPEQIQVGSFLGIGDGIYNTADPRWRPDRGGLPSVGEQLARLPGSALELQACAREWHSHALLLTGFDATRPQFKQALAQRPSVIHIAAHVVQVGSGVNAATIELGLLPNGQPESIGTADISGFHLGGSTVVMSGCSSSAFEGVPGAAISGLTRAWLDAGAGAVIGSRWATPDDTGELFQVLYRDLRIRSDRGADRRVIGASLQRAQQEMLHSVTWRSNPSYWAAFSVAEKE